MARDFIDDIKQANAEGRPYHAIVPCGPKQWYEPFVRMVNTERVSLKNMTCFHMDENQSSLFCNFTSRFGSSLSSLLTTAYSSHSESIKKSFSSAI